MDRFKVVHQTSAAYQPVLVGLLVLFPSVLAAYMAFNGGERMMVESEWGYAGLAFVVAFVSWFFAAIAYSCYASTGERGMRYIVWGLQSVGLEYLCRAFAPYGDYFSSGFGSEPRCFLSLMLVLALLRWRSNPEDAAGISWRKHILAPWVLLVAAQLIVSLIAHELFPFWSGYLFNGLSACLAVAGFIQFQHLPPPNRPMYLCLSVLIFIAQTSVTFILGPQWSHMWWFGHLLFLATLLLLGHGVMTAFTTTRSFAASQTEGEILELMRKAEEAAETAVRANAAKSRFMAAASHDLRQPLVPIKLFAELLETEIGRTPQGSLVRKLRGAVQSLDDLLNKMMEFSRLEAGVVHVRAERVRLGEVLKRFHQEFGPVAEAKGLKLHWVDCRTVVRTDRVLLELILRNLVENAIRYTKTGGVLIGCRHRRDHIRLCVYDTGIGIAADQQKDVFTEFFQGNPVGADRRVGLGLGLATVERLSRLMDVPIDMASIPGKGSCFAVTLPRTGERRA